MFRWLRRLQNDETETSSGRGRIDLIGLIDFDVQVLLTENSGVQLFDMTELVTSWMNDSFEQQLELRGIVGEYAELDTVILQERDEDDRRKLISSLRGGDTTGSNRLLQADSNNAGEIYTAEFAGAALFTRNENQIRIDQEIVLDMQRITLANDTALLEALQDSKAKSMGSAVLDVRAILNPSREQQKQNDDEGLEVVIIVAIVIACVAFLFLLFAIFWAWRYDKRNREAYLVGTAGKRGDNNRPDGTGSDNSYNDDEERRTAKSTPPKSSEKAEDHPDYPSEIGGEHVVGATIYPESVISEDISTSLSQYYRSGFGAASYDAAGTSARDNYRLNDAASVSSMESYGYSLDGYVPSMATPMPDETPMARAEAYNLPVDPPAATDDNKKYEKA